MSSSDDAPNRYRELGEAAWAWVQRQIRDDDGPWRPGSVTGTTADETPPDDRDSVYTGIGGLSLLLAEIRQSRTWTDAEHSLAEAITARLLRRLPERVEPSLYDGLGGDLITFRLMATAEGQGATAADRAVRAVGDRLLALLTPTGWESTLGMVPGSTAPLTDLILGTAGVVLAALWADVPQAEQIATAGCEILLGVAEQMPVGLNWRIHPGYPASSPNYSHGTAGVAATLAVAGTALGRSDFVAAAVDGARHVLDVGSFADGGLVVPHTIPPSTRDVEPVTYTWCHGPTGTSHLFTALAHAHVHELGGFDVRDLHRRCLHSVLTSGVPQRLRPGFWDNDGRCCGTAGVGDVLLDAAQAARDPEHTRAMLGAARVMGDALVERAVVDDDGARWRFVEHRQDPPLLPPGTSWMQGAAGIGAFLLRLSRVCESGPTAPVVDRPDQWWSVPAAVRTVAPRQA